jgi:transposase-like protein
VPRAALHYLAHTESGTSIRAIAREAGCHASTILRQIRACETRRDDLLFDHALRRLGQRVAARPTGSSKKENLMIAYSNTPAQSQKAPLTEQRLSVEALRILRRLSETGALLAVAQNMQKAIVMRNAGTRDEVRTAVVDNEIAEAMALKQWISCDTPGRVSRYHITREGRLALNKMMAETENRASGFAEASVNFQGAPMIARPDHDEQSGKRKRIRYGSAESPVAALARRKDKNGRPFLSQDLVRAGERLREDFELSGLDKLNCRTVESLTGAIATLPRQAGGPETTACERVVNALRELGPGLGDVALNCCCHLEGLEKAEKRMGWSARSGKIVLRIALQRLKRQYDSAGDHAGLMG